MSRTDIPLQTMTGWGAGKDDITWTAGNSGTGMSFDNKTGRVLLLMRNANASAKTATVNGVASPKTYNAAITKTITVVGLGATTGKYCIYGPFDTTVFNQSDGTVNVDIADATDVQFAALLLANPPPVY